MNKYESDTLSKHIIQTLLYFDIFNYPLASDEVYEFLQTNHITQQAINERLHQLVTEKLTYSFGQFFTLQNDKTLIERRIRGNKEAMRYMIIAHKQAAFINKFPFVKSVMASGSLSKGYMDESCDLDFFIVTKSQRLWITRTLLVLYKRIFLGNSHKYFCVNYFVDEANLEIEEKNLYTAIELSTLIPLVGFESYKKLMAANPWTMEYLPNSTIKIEGLEEKYHTTILKNVVEGILNLFFPRILNSFFMRLTLRRWKLLYENLYEKEDFKIAFKSKANVSKNHPNYYQKKVMCLYHKKRKDFSNRYNLNWDV